MTTREPLETASVVPAEARTHQGHEAGIVSRLIAAALDLLVVNVLLVATYAGWAVGLFVLDPRSFSFPRPSPALIGVAYLVVAMAYLAIPWSVTGRSYGQHVMGLRVVDGRGSRLRFWQALLRSAICVGFPLGLLWVVVSRRSAAVHDLLLHTHVTYDWTTSR